MCIRDSAKVRKRSDDSILKTALGKSKNRRNRLAKDNPNSIVLLDAFSSLIRATGLDEYKPEAVEPISALSEALAETRATPIFYTMPAKAGMEKELLMLQGETTLFLLKLHKLFN